MSEAASIRESLSSDLASIAKLHVEAFPDEDLRPLVRELLLETPKVLSLVVIKEGFLAGHIIFTPCNVGASVDQVALLGPLAVASAWRRQGIGRALVGAGLQCLESAGVGQVCVLGDPAYYGRLGFVPEADIVPPYPLPAEWHGAWQSIGPRGAPSVRGKLSVPQPWRQPGLWAP